MRPTRHTAVLLAILTLWTAGACDTLTAPDFNNPSTEDLLGSPSRTAVADAATGLVIGARDNISEFNGYVSLLGILGRESYNLDRADTRFVTQMLEGPLDPGARALGGNLWILRYRNIRGANLVLEALDALPDVPPTGMTPAEKEAVRGFAKTMQALDFLLVINTRDTNGAPIDVDRPLEAPPAPIEPKEAVLAHIVALLDEAAVHLGSASAEFPFALSPGFAGFDTPATFLLFNRAILARVEVYRMNFAAALAALNQSFLDPGAPLDLGVFHTFTAGAGDVLNGLVDPELFAHPSIEDDAERQPNGELDARFLRKLNRVAAPPPLQGLTSDLRFDPLYPSPTAPVPIIRNEELILLRAEANIGLGNVAAAIQDINLIRVESGGLEPRNDLNAANILDELLHQKRYSLLFEGGHRWIDMRRYGKLDELPLDRPGHRVIDRFPIPTDEQLPRE